MQYGSSYQEHWQEPLSPMHYPSFSEFQLFYGRSTETILHLKGNGTPIIALDGSTRPRFTKRAGRYGSLFVARLL